MNHRSTAHAAPIAPMQIGALLAAKLDTLDLDVESAAAELAPASVANFAGQLTSWHANKPVTDSNALRAAISLLRIERHELVGHVPAVRLVSALWSPAAGDELSRAREARGLSREEVAAVAGVSDATLRRWENSQVAPRTALLAPVLAFLGVDADTLVALCDWPPASLPTGHRPAFGTWLLASRKALGLSQEALAKKLDMAQCKLQSWEYGRVYPARSSWAAVAKKLTSVGAPITAKQLMQLQMPEIVQPDALAKRGPVARLLTQARMDLLLSREAAADRVNTTAVTFKRWEDGDRKPDLETWPRLVKALELNQADLVEALQADRFGERRDLGTFLWARRTTLGMSPTKLGERLRVHRNQVSFWETGKVAPRVSRSRVAKVLRVPLEVVAFMPANGVDHQPLAGLRERRLEAGLTQYELADILGVTQTDISNLELGYAGVPLGKQTKVAAFANAAVQAA